MLLGTATHATDGFCPLKPVNKAVDDHLPALTNDVMEAAENLHRALMQMKETPTPKNSIVLRQRIMSFSSLSGRFSHLAATSEYALDMKLPTNIRPIKREC